MIKILSILFKWSATLFIGCFFILSWTIILSPQIHRPLLALHLVLIFGWGSITFSWLLFIKEYRAGSDGHTK